MKKGWDAKGKVETVGSDASNAVTQSKSLMPRVRALEGCQSAMHRTRQGTLVEFGLGEFGKENNERLITTQPSKLPGKRSPST